MERVSARWLTLCVLFACGGRVDSPSDNGAGQGGGQAGGGSRGGAAGARSGGAAGGVTSGSDDPGRVTLRRLSRREYNNTVRDLLGTSQRPADRFPEDGRALGFDVIADVLTLSPVHLEMHEAAATALIDEAFKGGVTPAAAPRLLPCNPSEGEACVRRVLADFARRAWRRPAKDDELADLVRVVDTARTLGDPVGDGVKAAFVAMLMSPRFLFRVEIDPTPTSKTAHALDGYDMATRLSYFLWATMPDDRLFAAAAADKLRSDDDVRAEVRRMLLDAKVADGLVSALATQWLGTVALESHDVDKVRYPAFDEPLRASMREESTRFVATVLRDRLPIRDLLQADWTMIDARLARHYGMPAPASGFARVSLAGTQRTGVLGQAALLTSTSHSDRTSPSVRGRWVMDQILCSAPPPPPPDAPPFDAQVNATGTVRQRLVEHRSNPRCAACHTTMDPIGFALETFDAIGASRDKDNGSPIDATGEIDGKRFDGPKQLAGLLAADDRFADCFARKLYVYALGRDVETTAGHLDDSTLRQLAGSLRNGEGKLDGLIEAITLAPTFRQRRGEP